MCVSRGQRAKLLYKVTNQDPFFLEFINKSVILSVVGTVIRLLLIYLDLYSFGAFIPFCFVQRRISHSILPLIMKQLFHKGSSRSKPAERCCDF